MKLLRDIAKSGGKAVLVVSHDQRIREVADRVLWLEDGRLKDMSRLVIDPVCGMSIGEDTPHTLTHQARRFYFCSAGCLSEFAESPSRFLAGAREVGAASPGEAGYS
jgi:putative ABC transport system ATP-binding protein